MLNRTFPRQDDDDVLHRRQSARYRRLQHLSHAIQRPLLCRRCGFGMTDQAKNRFGWQKARRSPIDETEANPPGSASFHAVKALLVARFIFLCSTSSRASVCISRFSRALDELDQRFYGLFDASWSHHQLLTRTFEVPSRCSKAIGHSSSLSYHSRSTSLRQRSASRVQNHLILLLSAAPLIEYPCPSCRTSEPFAMSRRTSVIASCRVSRSDAGLSCEADIQWLHQHPMLQVSVEGKLIAMSVQSDTNVLQSIRFHHTVGYWTC